MSTTVPPPSHSKPYSNNPTVPTRRNPSGGFIDRLSTPMEARRRRQLWISYGLDWVLTLVIWAAFYGIDKINGYRRLFSITDTSLRYPYADPDRIPVWALALIAGVFPLLVILITAATYTKSFFDAQVGSLGLALSLGITVTITNIIKVTVGRPRPDLIDRCQPPLDYTENPVHALTSWTVCTRTDLLQEGFRSFPSGHSSFAWSGLFYLTLFMAGKMRIWDRKGYTLKSWLLVIPLVSAALVSVSRAMDYRHHATDLLIGGLLGTVVAWYTYRQYYRPLDDPMAHRPWPPRIERPEEEKPDHDPEAHGGYTREDNSDRSLPTRNSLADAPLINRGGAGAGLGVRNGNGAGNGYTDEVPLRSNMGRA